MTPTTVLHVDDDPAFADLVAMFLERECEDITVVTETDPRDARERFVAESEAIDCVVSDYDMPGMNGLELLCELRTIDSELPFVLFTGRGNEEIASEAITTGVTDYLRKGAGTDQYAVLAHRLTNAVSKRRAEAERTHSEARYERLVESSPVPIALYKPEEIIYANEAAATFFGAAGPDELVGMPPVELVHTDDRELAAERMKRVLDAGESVPPVEERFVGLDGELRYATIASAPVTVDGESVAQVVLNDLTEYRRAERELRDEQAFTDTVLDTLDDAFYVLDTDGRLSRWNERFTEVTGYTDTEIESMYPTDFFAEEDAGRVAEAIETVLDTGHASITADTVTKSGDRIPYEFVGSRLTDADGEVIGVCGIGRDVSDRLEHERELERRTELFEKIFEHSGDALFVFDPANETITECNMAACAMLGYDREDLVALSPEAVQPDQMDLFHSFIDRVLETGEGWTDEFTCLTSDGRRLSSEISASRIDLDGRPHVLANVPAGVLAEDSTREILFANRSFCELFSIRASPDDLVGADCVAVAESVKDLFVDSERFVESNDTSVDEGRTVSREEFALVDGRTIERSATSIPVAKGADRYLWFYHDITERKQAEQTLRALHEGTREMMAATSREDVCSVAAETSKRVLGHSITVVRLLAADGETLVPIVQTTETRERIGDRPAYSIYDTPAGEAFREGVPRIYDDLATLDEATLDASYDPGNSRAAMYVPLGAHGVISIADTDADRFDRSDLQLAKVLGANAETALDRVDHERTLEALHEGTRQMMSAETPAEVATLVVETARDALGLALTGCWLYDPDDVCLRPTAFTDEAHATFDDFPTFTADNSLSWRAFVTNEPAVYDDVGDRHGAYDPETLIGSEMIVPLGDYGILNSGSTELGTFDDADIAAMRILAANAEAALERAEREALLRDRETQLERERDNLAALFENVPDPMYRYRRENGAVIPEATNPAFERVFGYDAERVVGRPLTETIVPIDGVEEHDDLTAIAVAGNPIETEIERLTTTGRRTFLLRNAPIDGSPEDETAGYAIYTDVTERHETEAYRRRLYEVVSDTELSSEERIRELLDLGRERLGMETAFLTHIEGDVARVVDSPRPHNGIEPGDEHLLSEVYCRQTVATTDPITVIQHAGESDWADDPAYERLGVETYVGLQLTVDDDLYGTVCFADREPRETDFSPVETAFVDLVTRGIASELERRRYERELERQNERLEQFASVLSHDLRNPLGIAEGYLSFLPEDGNEEALEKVHIAHDRMERIIEDVLALTRQGKTVADIGVLPLATVAEAAWDHIETGRARLVTADDLGNIEADWSRLATLFENLFRNAVEHAGETVTVRIERTNTGFAVGDDGPGIPTEKREQVFEYGHTTGSGTGLGLSIVRTVADAHGWEIVATASDAGGARFEISVPDAASR